MASMRPLEPKQANKQQSYAARTGADVLAGCLLRAAPATSRRAYERDACLPRERISGAVAKLTRSLREPKVCLQDDGRSVIAGRQREGPEWPQHRADAAPAHRPGAAPRAHRPRRALQAHRHRGGVDLSRAGQGAGRVLRKRRGAGRSTALRMGGMFSKHAEPAGDAAGPRRAAPRAHGRIRHRPAAPAADRAGRAGGAAGRRHVARARGQRHRRRRLPPPSRTASRPARRSIRATSRARSGRSSGRWARSSSTARCSTRTSRGTTSTSSSTSRSSRRSRRTTRRSTSTRPRRSTRRTTRAAASSARSAGFPHDVWLHTMGLIFSGAFDRFPKLRLVIGHMGECMPLQLYRFDWMQGNADGRAHLRGGQQVKLQHPVSHYFRNNIWITTSGVAWEPAIKFCMERARTRARALRDGLSLPAVARTRSPPTTGCSLSPEHKKMLMQDQRRARVPALTRKEHDAHKSPF